MRISGDEPVAGQIEATEGGLHALRHGGSL